MLKILKALGWTLVALPLLLLIAYWVVVGINLRDQPPSAAALGFEAALAGRPPVADAENGYVYLLGFEAPEGVDVAALGVARARWLAQDDGSHRETPDPLAEAIDYSKGRSAVVTALLASCKPDDLSA